VYKGCHATFAVVKGVDGKRAITQHRDVSTSAGRTIAPEGDGLLVICLSDETQNRIGSMINLANANTALNVDSLATAAAAIVLRVGRFALSWPRRGVVQSPQTV
jgi:hypothetical protein